MSAPIAGVAVAVAVVAFGGAYALGHGESTTAPADLRPAATIELAEDPLPRLGKASPLPGLAAAVQPAAPAADPEPESDLEPEPGDVEQIAPVTPVPTPAPTPTPAPQPTPAPAPEPAPPSNFDDSG